MTISRTRDSITPTLDDVRGAWQVVKRACERHAEEAHAGAVAQDPDCEICTLLDDAAERAAAASKAVKAGEPYALFRDRGSE